MRSRLTTRLVTAAVVAALAIAAILLPGRRFMLIEAAVAGLLGVGLGDLFTLGLERLVGMRYLYRGRRSRGARAALVAGFGLMAVGFGVFALAHGHSRAIETVAVLGVLSGGLTAVVAFLLRTFSVFTTVSTMGVVLGVASLVVVLAVTSGFEREFQDKVLALNAHLIVMPYGDADVQVMRQLGPQRDPPDVRGRLARRARGERAAGRLFEPLDAAGDQRPP